MSSIRSSSASAGRSPQSRLARRVGVLVVAVIAATGCGGSDGADAGSVRVVAADGSDLDFAVTVPERIEIDLADQEIVTITEQNTTDQLLEYSIGIAVDGDGCTLNGVPRWDEVESLVDDGQWPQGLTSLPAGTSGGTVVSAEVPGTCRELGVIVVARSSDGSTSKTELTVPTTVG